jgi:hypothetical protein
MSVRIEDVLWSAPGSERTIDRQGAEEHLRVRPSCRRWKCGCASGGRAYRALPQSSELIDYMLRRRDRFARSSMMVEYV